MCHCSNLIIKNNLVLRYTSVLYTSVLVCTNNCSVDPSNGDLDTMTDFFIKCWLNSYCLSSELSCLFIFQRNSLTNVIEVECACSYFAENSIATSFLFVHCEHIVVYVLCTHYCMLRLHTYA